MISLSDFYLKINPFRIIPSINSAEVIWAGFPDIKQEIKKQIGRIICGSNSAIVLNWGEYGSGKTHSIRYFSKKEVLDKLAKGQRLPLTYDIPFPKGKDPVKEIFTQIVDRIDFSELKDALDSNNVRVKDIAANITDNNLIKQLLIAIFSQDNPVTEDQIKSYLYGNSSKAEQELFKKSGIQRELETDSDYVDFISGLFSLLTYNKQVYSSVIFWIDEFEDIALLNNSNIAKINNFIRTLIEKTPNNLLVFLNLTKSSMMDVSDLGEYLSEALRSRIKTKIEFSAPDSEKLRKYLEELLNNEIVRTEGLNNPYYPFSKEVVDKIIKDFPNQPLRKYNLLFSNLLETAQFDFEESKEIDLDFYKQYAEELIPF